MSSAAIVNGALRIRCRLQGNKSRKSVFLIPWWGGRVVRRCWINFQCRGVLLIWMIVGQGPIALAVGAGGGGLDIFTLICPFFSFSLSLGDGPI